MIAVSYTHLDVYKRQVLLRPLVNGGCMAVVLLPGGSDMAGKPVNIILPLVGQLLSLIHI